MRRGTPITSPFGSETHYGLSKSLVLQVVLILLAPGSQTFRGFTQLGRSLAGVCDGYQLLLFRLRTCSSCLTVKFAVGIFVRLHSWRVSPQVVARFSMSVVIRFVCMYYMDPCQRLSTCRGGAPRASSSRHMSHFGWESVANYFNVTPLMARKEILNLEAKEFGDHKYFSYSKIMATVSNGFFI